MNRRPVTVVSGLVAALALVACTHKSDDSPAMSKAKTDTNTAIEAGKGAVLNATDAAKDEARVLAQKTQAAATEAKESPEMRKAEAETRAAVIATKEKAAEVAAGTKALADKAADKISN